jgi:hypothetical protein
MSTGDEQAEPWIPEEDPATLSLIGKIGEEAGELASVCCRVVIQGMDGINPKDGRTNRVHLVEEMADVRAQIHVAQELLGIRKDTEREGKKTIRSRNWMGMLYPNIFKM